MSPGSGRRIFSLGTSNEATAREIAERTARDTDLGVRIVKVTREVVWTRPPTTPDSE